MTLTLNFQGQILNWLYVSQKWSDCHETKSKHIDWALGFKRDHRVRPWSWPWPWIFKVKYRIGYIPPSKMVWLQRNEKQTHRLNSRLQMGPSGLTLALTLTLNFQGQISNWLYLSQKWSDCHETKSKHINWTLISAMTLIFEFSRSYVILTIWWPRSGVRIYRGDFSCRRAVDSSSLFMP